MGNAIGINSANYVMYQCINVDESGGRNGYVGLHNSI